MSATQHNYDVFISHASEDKIGCAKLLADELMSYGAIIWYDEFSLEIGDSLSKSITEGLAKSNYGIVVLSKDFISKGWTNFELEGLINREIGNRKIILPVWHNITHAELMKFSPVVAGRVALDTSKNLLKINVFEYFRCSNRSQTAVIHSQPRQPAYTKVPFEAANDIAKHSD